MAVSEVEPETENWEESRLLQLPHTDLMTCLATLDGSITAPVALLKFHSARPLVEHHQNPVTFLVSIGMRDPKSLLCCATGP